MAAPKFTPQTRAAICDRLRKGLTVEGATGLAGIHRDTYYGWLEKGNAARALRDQGKPVPRRELPFLHFADDVDLARAHGEGFLTERALEAIANPKDFGRWQGYVTLLERTRPDRWRRRASTEYAAVKADTGRAEFTFDPTKLTNDELEELRGLLTKAAPRED